MYIATHLVNALVRDGDEVIAVPLRPPGHAGGGCLAPPLPLPMRVQGVAQVPPQRLIPLYRPCGNVMEI